MTWDGCLSWPVTSLDINRKKVDGNRGMRGWETMAFQGCVLEAPVVSISGLSCRVALLSRSVRDLVLGYFQVVF